MTDQEALRNQLHAMMEKSARALRAAKEHITKGDADFASSKAYYSVFHLMQAALLTKGKTYSKHAGVISGFSEEFIKTGIFARDYGEAIQRLRKDRELGDYGYQLSVSFEEATKDVKAAEEIGTSILKYLHTFISQRK